MKLAWSQGNGIRGATGVSGTTAAQRVDSSGGGYRMLSVQSCSRVNMAGFPPALPGFGSSGKSFLIDNLLQAQTQTPSQPNGLKGSHLRSSWASDFGLYQSQGHRKDLGGPPTPPHSAGKGATFHLTAIRLEEDYLGYMLARVSIYNVNHKMKTQD